MTKKKQAPTQKTSLRLHRYFPFLSAMILLLGIAAMDWLFIHGSHFGEAMPAKYWLEYGDSSRETVLNIFLISLPVFLVLMGFQLWMKKYISSVFIGIAAFLVAGCSLMTWLILPSHTILFGEVRHEQTLETETHIYHADSTWKVGVGSASKAGFYLWQCNKQGNNCERLYIYITPAIFTEKEYHNTTVEIRSQDGVIQLIRNGDVVYSQKE